MSLTVEGRKDTFLERKKALRFKALQEFLNEFLIEKEFEDIDAVKTVLSTWPKWSKGKSKDIHTRNPEMAINMDQMTIWSGESLGGEFVVGHVIEIKE